MTGLFILVLTSCKPLPHHNIQEDVLLKDKIYIHIETDFVVETPEALKEVRLKSDQLEFALRLALREHASTELQGRGKRSVLNAWKSITKQVLDHPVKEVHIITYEFYDKNNSSSS